MTHVLSHKSAGVIQVLLSELQPPLRLPPPCCPTQQIERASEVENNTVPAKAPEDDGEVCVGTACGSCSWQTRRLIASAPAPAPGPFLLLLTFMAHCTCFWHLRRRGKGRGTGGGGDREVRVGKPYGSGSVDVGRHWAVPPDTGRTVAPPWARAPIVPAKPQCQSTLRIAGLGYSEVSCGAVSW